jgi:hypothetical protein
MAYYISTSFTTYCWLIFKVAPFIASLLYVSFDVDKYPYVYFGRIFKEKLRNKLNLTWG